MNRFVLFAGIWLLSITAFGQEQPFQLWNSNSIRVGLSEHTSIRVSEKVQYFTDTGSVGLKYGDITLLHQLNHWLEVGAGGRLLWFGREDGWLAERRPMIYGNVKGSMGQLDLYFYNRIEYRVFSEADNHFRHWHVFTIEVPPFQSSWLKLYLSEEGFIKFTEENFHLARIYAGSKIRCNDYLSMKLFYALEKNKSPSHWFGSDVLGLNLSFAF